jgi:Mrp family chromosome partitioning ATPase/capsular polysaccharide biosynthesis protein
MNEAFEVLSPSRRSPASVSPIRRLLFLRQQKWVVLLCTLLMGILGVIYILQRSPTFTANGLLMVENIQLDTGRSDLIPAMGNVDTSLVDTQVVIIKSDAVALKAIKALNVADNDPRSGVFGWLASLRRFLPPTGEVGEVDERLSAQAKLRAFDQNLSVKRIGTTYTIDVRFTARTPEMAAEATNEVIKVYLADQAAAGVASASSASAWLRERIKDVGPKTRVISFASPPMRSDGPGRLKLLSAFIAFGALSGLGLAVARVMLDSTLKDPQEAETKVGANFLGAVKKFSRGASLKQAESGHDSVENSEHERGSTFEIPQHMRMALDLPHSDLASTIGRARAAIARAASPSLVGVTSLTSGEGVTTIASNLATSAAAAGSRVLLIDANRHQPVLSEHLGGNVWVEFEDLIAGSVPLQEVLRRHSEMGLHFLSLAGPNLAGRDQRLWIELAALVRTWKADYDLIILDLPPLLPTGNVAFANTFVESLLLVVQWGGVSSELMQNVLAASGIGSDDLCGFIFNKVPSSAIRRSTFPVEAYIKQYAGRTAAAPRSARGRE